MHNKPIQPTPKTARLMGSVRHKDAMTDLAEIFQDGPPRKGMYLSRVFGIFNEEIVRIWAQDPRSPYQVFEKRPTLYDAGKPYTLDFLFPEKCACFCGGNEVRNSVPKLLVLAVHRARPTRSPQEQ